MKVVVIDPRRTATCGTSPTCIWPSVPAAMPGCSTACSTTCGGRRHRLEPIWKITMEGFGAAPWKRSAASTFPAVAGKMRLAGGRRGGVLPSVHANTQRRHRVLAGHQPVLVRRRQGQQHPQRASGAPAGSACRAPVPFPSPASPTPWAGARWAGWPTNWPRTWTSCRNASSGWRASGNAPQHQPTVPASRRSSCSMPCARADQGGLDHGHQPGGEPA